MVHELTGMRDPYTVAHERRVAEIACLVASDMGLDDDTITGLSVACHLHDVGKIMVPVEILNKPGKISEWELGFIRQHSQSGYNILRHIPLPWPIATIALQHHERLDGSGYPHHLKESELLLESRILSVVDTFEAMASNRPYRFGLGVDRAMDELIYGAGVRYDSRAVYALKRLVDQGVVLIND